MKTISLLGVGILALSTTIGFAQAAPAAVQHKTATINQRQAIQKHRIAQGLNKGTLNVRQAKHLNRKEVSIKRQARRMRAANGGHLTRANRVRLNRKLNRTSRAIYRAKRRNVTKNAVMNQ